MNLANPKTNIKRRSLFAAIPALAATATGALAFKAPDGPVDDLPDWWKDLTTYQKVHHHMQEITDLLTGDAPEGCDVNGVCWRIADGQAEPVWASGQSGPHLVNYRESEGWTTSKIKFVGQA